MPAPVLVAIPDTDGELVLWLERLEELLISLSPLAADPAAWEPPLPPIGDGAALTSLQALLGAVLAAEGAASRALIAPDGRFELIPLRFVTLDRADVARVAAAITALTRASARGGDETVADALADHAAADRLTIAALFAGCARAHALLDLACTEDVTELADLIARSPGPIVLSACVYAAYRRLTDRHLAVFHPHDPLARFLYNGATPINAASTPRLARKGSEIPPAALSSVGLLSPTRTRDECGPPSNPTTTPSL